MSSEREMVKTMAREKKYENRIIQPLQSTILDEKMFRKEKLQRQENWNFQIQQQSIFPLQITKLVHKQTEKKQKNLKLREYLRLTALSQKQRRKSIAQKNKQTQNSNMEKSKRYSMNIDTKKSISQMKKQTKQAVKGECQKLKELVEEITKEGQLDSDEESLLLLCNILNVFEEKIFVGVKYTNQLIKQKKKNKHIEGLKKYGEEIRKINLKEKSNES